MCQVLILYIQRGWCPKDKTCYLWSSVLMPSTTLAPAILSRVLRIKSSSPKLQILPFTPSADNLGFFPLLTHNHLELPWQIFNTQNLCRSRTHANCLDLATCCCGSLIWELVTEINKKIITFMELTFLWEKREINIQNQKQATRWWEICGLNENGPQ